MASFPKLQNGKVCMREIIAFGWYSAAQLVPLMTYYY